MTLRDLIDDGRVHVVDGAVGDRTISFQGQELGFDPPFKRIRLLDALGEALGEVGIDPTRRAEDLALEEFRALSRASGI